MVKHIIEFNKVNRVYRINKKEINCLTNVDLKIKPGDFVVISGPSGSGKTSILNLIGGLDTPTNGSILIDGKEISKYEEYETADLRAEFITYILRTGNMLPALTVSENISLVSNLTGKNVNVIEVLQKVGLEKLKNKFFHQLTPIEQQQVAIARAFAKDSQILLCDEPTGELLSDDIAKVLTLLKEYNGKGKEKKTVVITTTNPLIESIADVVVKVKNGKIEKSTRSRAKTKKKIEAISW